MFPKWREALTENCENDKVASISCRHDVLVQNTIIGSPVLREVIGPT